MAACWWPVPELALWGHGETGGTVGLAAPLLALKPVGLGRRTSVTQPRGCAGGRECFRVLTYLAMP